MTYSHRQTHTLFWVFVVAMSFITTKLSIYHIDVQYWFVISNNKFKKSVWQILGKSVEKAIFLRSIVLQRIDLWKIYFQKYVTLDNYIFLTNENLKENITITKSWKCLCTLSGKSSTLWLCINTIISTVQDEHVHRLTYRRV